MLKIDNKIVTGNTNLRTRGYRRWLQTLLVDSYIEKGIKEVQERINNRNIGVGSALNSMIRFDIVY